MLGYYQYEGRGDPVSQCRFYDLLVALITDFLDGYLARQMESRRGIWAGGRSVCGQSAGDRELHFFCGKELSSSRTGNWGVYTLRFWVRRLPALRPGWWLSFWPGELLVTSFRGMSEGSGQNFGAVIGGKVKMVFQSVTILVILVYVNYCNA